MDYSFGTLEQIPGTEPGHSFLVIGKDETNGFRGAIRFWAQGGLYVPITDINFRFRVERLPDLPPITSIAHTLKTAYPKVQWMSGSHKHGSISGSIRAKVNISEYEELCGILAGNGAIAAIYDALVEGFPTMDFAMNRAEFTSFFVAEIEKHMKAIGVPQFDKTENEQVDVFLKFISNPGTEKEKDALDQVIAQPEPSEKNAKLVKQILADDDSHSELDVDPTTDPVYQATMVKAITVDQPNAAALTPTITSISPKMDPALTGDDTKAPEPSEPPVKSPSLKLPVHGAQDRLGAPRTS
jgi:hypothetical protein